MFVAQVVGKSMEPRIPDGSYCVFRAWPEGSRQGKIVLVQHHEISDPDTGGRYTVKVYQSQKESDGFGGWHHTEIKLEPVNPDYEPIAITDSEENEVRVIAELVEVLG